MGDQQGKLFGDDMLPPRKKGRGGRRSRTEHHHVIPKDQQGSQFAGAAYQAKHDEIRLTGKLEKLRALMVASKNYDFRWRTLESISSTLEALHEGERFPEASVSALLRALRDPINGAHKVDRKHVGERSHGLYAYRVRPASDPAPEDRGGAK